MAKDKGKKSGSRSGGGGGGGPAAVAASSADVPPRLRERYRSEVVPALMKQFGYANPMQVPRLVKVALNAGLGEAVANPNIIKTAADELTAIAGQRVVVTKAKKSIANFKLREGLPIGCMVTLRRERMWEFLDRLFNVAMPRIRDFKGFSLKAFDGHGNYTLPLTEQTIFLEVVYDNVERTTGYNVSFVTTAKTDEECQALLKSLGLPFRN